MTLYTGLVLEGDGLVLRRRVTSLPASGTFGEIVVLTSSGEYHEWSGAVWVNKGAAVPTGGGGSGSPNLDGGTASSVFGGIDPIDGGTA